MKMSPGVWFLAATYKGLGWKDDASRILSAARHFRSMPDQEARNCEAMGRLLGVALEVLDWERLPPLDAGWEPDWLISKRDESNDELDWSSICGMSGRSRPSSEDD